MTDNEVDNNEQVSEIPVKYMVVEAVITRADGTIENLGVIAGKHKNPIKNAAMQLGIKIRGYKRKWHKFLQTEVKK